MQKWKLADVRESKAIGNFEALFTIDNEENGKSYVLYTDKSMDEEGYMRVYASFFDVSRGTEELYPLETEEEWRMIEEILEQVEQSLEEGMEEEEIEEEDLMHVEVEENQFPQG